MCNKCLVVALFVCTNLQSLACNPSPSGSTLARPASTESKNPEGRPVDETGRALALTQKDSVDFKDEGSRLEEKKKVTDQQEPVLQKPLLRVYLQPLGESLPNVDITFIRQALSVFYPLDVVELPSVPLPKDAYYAPRSRYRAEKLLTRLTELAPSDSHVIIGLTSVDISTTKGEHQDWGILGLASVGGGECVVSRFRAQRGARDDLHTRERLAKTVVHEVGHTLGLRHCSRYGCLMEDGMGTVTTTDHEYDLCSQCRGLLAENVKEKNEDAIPWQRP